VDYAGIPDCLGNLNTITGVMDEEGLEWERFLLMVQVWSGGKPFPTKDLVTAIARQTELRDAVPAGITADVEDGKPDAYSRVLGGEFKKRQGRYYGPSNIYLVKGANDPHTKAATWRVDLKGG
jgi:hypothetical protein